MTAEQSLDSRHGAHSLHCYSGNEAKQGSIFWAWNAEFALSHGRRRSCGAALLLSHFKNLMLATIAVILIVIWAIGFFARLVGHIIHAVLLVAFLLLVAHYFRQGKLDHFGRDWDPGLFHHRRHVEVQ
jgi:hypothetical protein